MPRPGHPKKRSAKPVVNSTNDLAVVLKNQTPAAVTSQAQVADTHKKKGLKAKKAQLKAGTAQKFGLLVSSELEEAYERVRKQVEQISKTCRAANRKYRDLDFDLENDTALCLHTLSGLEDRTYGSDGGSVMAMLARTPDPPAVLRVTDIFPDPQFFVNGSQSSDVEQGALGDCYFLDALATVAVKEEVLKKICVAMDVQVGVYGFLFQRDGHWVDVIIDDFLFVKNAEFEALSGKERDLFHSDKDLYNKLGRIGRKTLWFARGTTENETWVPLIEKAYAKLHGDFESVDGGYTGEALEDLTGGVASVIHVKDILDKDAFWKNELLNAAKDRLFSCSILLNDLSASSMRESTVQGLLSGHAYSILGALEYNGKRFVRVRNPWAETEWTGRWSDGSKEWTDDWLGALKPLEHKFGNDGAFIMEYEDFLSVWTRLDRTRLLDESWIVSALWVNATLRPPSSAWDFGDVSFTFNIAEPGPCIIVLAQLDTRYFAELSGPYEYSLDFVLFRKGVPTEIASARNTTFGARSVNVELDLEEGEYVVHVRVDQRSQKEPGYIEQHMPRWNDRKLKSVAKQAAISASLASNSDYDSEFLPRAPELWAGRDITEVEVDIASRLQGLDTVGGTASETQPTDGPNSALMDRIESATREVDGVDKKADSNYAQDVPLEEAFKKTLSLTVKGDNEAAAKTPEVDGISSGETKESEAAVVPASADVKKEEVKEQEDSASVPDVPVHLGITCNGCWATPIFGIRYKCLETSCPDYDLCMECFSAQKHEGGKHRMLPLVTPEVLQELDFNSDIGPPSDFDITLGLRVYTKRDAPTAIKSQLRHGNITRLKA